MGGVVRPDALTLTLSHRERGSTWTLTSPTRGGIILDPNPLPQGEGINLDPNLSHRERGSIWTLIFSHRERGSIWTLIFSHREGGSTWTLTSPTGRGDHFEPYPLPRGEGINLDPSTFPQGEGIILTPNLKHFARRVRSTHRPRERQRAISCRYLWYAGNLRSYR